MAIISVDPKLLKQSAGTISDLSKKMNAVSSSLESINFNSFLEIKASSSLKRKISACNTEVEQYVKSFRGLSTTLTSIASLYEKTERGLLGSVYNGRIADAAIKSILKTAWDIVDTGIDIALAPEKMIEGLFTGGPAGLAKEGALLVYDLSEDCFKMGSHLVGLTTAGLAGVSLLFGSQFFTEGFLTYSEEYADVDRASDIAAIDGNKGLEKVFKSIESAHDTYEIVDDIDSFVKDPKKMISGFKPDEYKPLDGKKYYEIVHQGKKQGECIEDIKTYKKLYESYGRKGESYRYIKWGSEKIKNLVEAGTSDSDHKEADVIFEELKNIKGIKTVSDMNDLYGDVNDLLEDLVTSAGGGGFR